MMIFQSEIWGSKLEAGLASYKDDFRFLRIYDDASESAVVFEVFNKAKNIHSISKHNIPHRQSLGFQILYSE